MDATAAPSLFPRTETAPTAAGDDAAAAAAASDFSSFLRLLTAQLRNQDPLQPLDSTQFVAQLASFSTVEQLIGTNERLDAMTAGAAADRVASSASWLGREVSLTDSRFVATGEPVAFIAPPAGEGTRAIARVSALDGAPLRDMTVPAAGGTLEWDGLDAAGQPVLAKPARIELLTFNGDELVGRQPVGIFRTVTGLGATEDGPVFRLSDGGTARADEIAAIRVPETE